MSQPYVGQIEAFAFNFAPRNWAACNGQLLPINQNQALFSLLGTYYGGDGIRTFALPDLRGRITNSQGNGTSVGEVAGEENHTLLSTEAPTHTHQFNAFVSNPPSGNTDTPGNTVVLTTTTSTKSGGTGPVLDLYAADTAPNQPLAPSAIGNAGGGQPHNNMMPYLTVNFCIALNGIFPSRG